MAVAKSPRPTNRNYTDKIPVPYPFQVWDRDEVTPLRKGASGPVMEAKDHAFLRSEQSSSPEHAFGHPDFRFSQTDTSLPFSRLFDIPATTSGPLFCTSILFRCPGKDRSALSGPLYFFVRLSRRALSSKVASSTTSSRFSSPSETLFIKVTGSSTVPSSALYSNAGLNLQSN